MGCFCFVLRIVANIISSSLGLKSESGFIGSILLIFSTSAILNPPSAEKLIWAENSTFPNASIFRFETLLITLNKTSLTDLSIALGSA